MKSEMEHIKLRTATEADAKTLFHWRNDPVTRAMFCNGDLVQWDLHLVWLRDVLARSDRRLLVASVNGMNIGTVRFDIFEEESELSWTIAPEQRGRGFGSMMVARAVQIAPEKVLRANIKSENTQSIRIAIKSGFIYEGIANGLNVWRLRR